MKLKYDKLLSNFAFNFNLRRPSIKTRRSAEHPSGPPILKTSFDSVLLNGAAAREMLTQHEAADGEPWGVKKTTAGGPFAIQHEPYVETAHGATLSTAELQGDHQFFTSRMPLCDEELTEQWLEAAVPRMSQKASEIIDTWARAKGGGRGLTLVHLSAQQEHVPWDGITLFILWFQ